jgi:hypothetical protein
MTADKCLEYADNLIRQYQKTMPRYWLRFFFGLLVCLFVVGGNVLTNLGKNSGPPNWGMILLAVGESVASAVTVLPSSFFGAVYRRKNSISRLERVKILARDAAPDSPDLLKAFGKLEAIEEQLG